MNKTAKKATDQYLTDKIMLKMKDQLQLKCTIFLGVKTMSPLHTQTKKKVLKIYYILQAEDKATFFFKIFT